MTTATVLEAPHRRSDAVHRIGSVIRLHFANPATLLVIPVIVLAGIFAINLAIWLIVNASIPTAAGREQAREGFQWSGASSYVFVYMTFVAILAMNATFRFAQGFSVTRRDYYLGTAVVFGMLSIGYTALLTILGLIETATDGWGLGGRMFTPVYLGPTLGDRVIVELCLFLVAFFIGGALATVFVRWRQTGILLFWGAVAVVAVAAGAIITLTDGWPSVGAWFDANLPTGLALWSLVPSAAFGVFGFFILRGATPKG